MNINPDKVSIVISVFLIMLYVATISVIGFVAWHFVSKYW